MERSPRALVTLLALVLSLFACGRKGPPPAPPPAQVKLLTVQPSSIEESSEFIAELNSRHAVTIQPQVSGTVSSVLVKAGAVVPAGAPLVQIDPKREQALLNNYVAARNARQANLKLAQDNFDRVKKLGPAGVVSQQELDQSASALAQAKADLAAADAQIRAQAVQSSYYRVTAPFAGVVGEVQVKIGDVVSPTTNLTTLTQDTALEADVSVPLTLAPKLGPDTRVEIVGPDDKVLARGKADFIAPSVDPATQSVQVKMLFENQGNFRYAQFVRARVIWGAKEGLRVPTVAVTRQSGQFFVYVAMPGPKDPNQLVAEQRSIKVGDIVENDYVVLDGLKAGDKVVVSGIQFVRNGAPVKAIPEQQAAEQQQKQG